MNEKYPKISILFITYKRIDLLKRTYESFLQNTDYPREKLELIICDDGSPRQIQDEIQKLYFDKYLLANRNQGLGANTNRGLIAASGEYIFQLQDDWECKGPKDYLSKSIEAFYRLPELGMIRFEGWENNNYNISKFVLDTDLVIKIVRESKSLTENISRIYSDRPHIKRQELHKEIGLYLEHSNMEKTEIDFCNRMAKQNKFAVGYIQSFEDIFINIGINNSLRQKQFKNNLHNIIMGNRSGAYLYKLYKNFKNNFYKNNSGV